MSGFLYKADYAKSGHAKCKSCNSCIDKNTLRVALLIQSPKFDGKIPLWHHFDCFFQKQTISSVAEVEDFDRLRWDDQELIRNKLGSSLPLASSSKIKYAVENAKSNRSKCKECKLPISKGEVRLSIKDANPAKSGRPAYDSWYHVDCFVGCKDNCDFNSDPSTLPGFQSLSLEDQKLLESKLETRKSRKRKYEGLEEALPSKKAECVNVDIMKEQSMKLFKIRDKLVEKDDINLDIRLLQVNGMNYLCSKDERRYRLADAMAFGVPEPCSICQNDLVFKSGLGYACTGRITEWTECTNIVKDPVKKPFILPDYLKDELGPFVGKVESRCFEELSAVEPPSGTSTQESLPLEGLVFCLDTKLGVESDGLKSKIKSLGGKVTSQVTEKTAALLSTSENVSSNSGKVKSAKKHNIHVVSLEFLDDVTKGGALLLIPKHSIASWGGDLESRVFMDVSAQELEAADSTVKLIAKNGVVVDPASGLADTASVVRANNLLYAAVLNKVELGLGTNSYYKLQLLKNGRKYHVFMSWGRIGTKIGGHKLCDFDQLPAAIGFFEKQFYDKSGNNWISGNYVKMPGKFYPLEIDYFDDVELPDNTKDLKKCPSQLSKELRELIELLFDIESMKNTMVEFELDLKKMPLGKISSEQIKKAFEVLQEASSILLRKGNDVKPLILDCSNRFYSSIPHDFGMNTPPLLDNEEIIKTKSSMLENLLDISYTYTIIQDTDANVVDIPMNHYKKLKSDIEPIKKESDEFKLIEEYLHNTHSDHHSHYRLELIEAFTVVRENEDDRFAPFKKNHNRKLLWHGSRLTNFVGILSQGLRIAPPEAPTTGYMFGKGVYFADMASKSANYCRTYGSDVGFLLLCEVALGDMYELRTSEFITKLPSGFMSTKGLGSVHPDPTKALIKDGLEIPIGTPVDTNCKGTRLIHNEYIVYDVAQVKIKYLLKVLFK